MCLVHSGSLSVLFLDVRNDVRFYFLDKLILEQCLICLSSLRLYMLTHHIGYFLDKSMYWFNFITG